VGSAAEGSAAAASAQGAGGAAASAFGPQAGVPTAAPTSQMSLQSVPKDLPGLLPNQFSPANLVCADTLWSAPALEAPVATPNSVVAEPPRGR
jgi:hypothetical protein